MLTLAVLDLVQYIIIMDEMISTGDEEFMLRAEARLTHLMTRAKILVLATHDPQIMQKFCRRVIWMHHGEIRKIGSFEDVYPEYKAMITGPTA